LTRKYWPIDDWRSYARAVSRKLDRAFVATGFLAAQRWLGQSRLGSPKAFKPSEHVSPTILIIEVTKQVAIATISESELVRLYSNLHSVAMRLCQLHQAAMSHNRSYPERPLSVPQRVDRRMGAAMIKRVVSEYVSGVSTTRLATRYGIGKGTLLRLIRESGVTVRRRGSRTSKSSLQ
jgi:hypothetical protein